MEMPYKYIRQGWQCPVCGKVHAPWASECDCHKTCANGTTTDVLDEITKAWERYLESERAAEKIAGEEGLNRRWRELEMIKAERKDNE